MPFKQVDVNTLPVHEGFQSVIDPTMDKMAFENQSDRTSVIDYVIFAKGDNCGRPMYEVYVLVKKDSPFEALSPCFNYMFNLKGKGCQPDYTAYLFGALRDYRRTGTIINELAVVEPAFKDIRDQLFRENNFGPVYTHQEFYQKNTTYISSTSNAPTSAPLRPSVSPTQTGDAASSNPGSGSSYTLK